MELIKIGRVPSEIEYKVLKNLDDKIEKILYSCNFSGVYEFEPCAEQWNSLNCEGTLYIL